jgi:uncharacterized protein YegP (UPF0339 family)
MITVEVYRDRRGEHRWRARHQNGNILADSAEGYQRPSRALQAATRFMDYGVLGRFRIVKTSRPRLSAARRA